MTSDRTWATYPQAASARAWKPDAADPDPAGQGTRRQLRGELFDGMAATGVIAADGTVFLGREVILSGGIYGSPAILLRSGVGPADELTALGIEVAADFPVGRRLHLPPALQ